ncbi:hypothetical protein THAOC_11736 [Thalassiosira oceanica]|uniref:Uncharacterized protein n=1 Tax=Thalassiosira oceanica TaxID=159749 RepID=K0SLU8_THAOC|nr:hypothetical protein THAOC_11736 [Thalassiosira oceanica]|eukprot:EJK67258.1 hypothetical protein THAOC_11736 [Thalassiosira oceanica]
MANDAGINAGQVDRGGHDNDNWQHVVAPSPWPRRRSISFSDSSAAILLRSRSSVSSDVATTSWPSPAVFSLFVPPPSAILATGPEGSPVDAGLFHTSTCPTAAHRPRPPPTASGPGPHKASLRGRPPHSKKVPV